MPNRQRNQKNNWVCALMAKEEAAVKDKSQFIPAGNVDRLPEPINW